MFLGQEVLGPEIFAQLTRDRDRRTLLIRLPAGGTLRVLMVYVDAPGSSTRITEPVPLRMG